MLQDTDSCCSFFARYALSIVLPVHGTRVLYNEISTTIEQPMQMSLMMGVGHACEHWEHDHIAILVPTTPSTNYIIASIEASIQKRMSN